MADFHQGGVITTLHRLGEPGVRRLEAELLGYARQRPIALVLPCLYSEIHGEGLKGIVDTGCIASKGPHVVVVGAGGEMYLSSDAGRRWTLVAEGIPSPSGALIV